VPNSQSTTAQALRIDMAGNIETITLDADDRGKFGPALRNAIDCGCFTVIQLTDTIDMYCDDEGAPDLADLDAVLAGMNSVATLLVSAHRAIHQPYFGTVVLFGHAGPRAVGLTDKQIARLRHGATVIAGQPGLRESLAAWVTELVNSGALNATIVVL